MVVAPVGFLGQDPLAVGAATKLATPDDEGVVQHAAILQILHQRRLGLINILRLPLDALRQPGVLIPPTVETLHKTHIALGQPSGQETITSEGAGLTRIGPVKLKGALRFI